jgi:hypothetical protein
MSTASRKTISRPRDDRQKGLHPHHFDRALRELKFLRTRLGGVICDIGRNIRGNPPAAQPQGTA